MENRTLTMHDIKTRSDTDEGPILEGYFAVFNEIYEVWPGATESIAPGAFSEALNGDIRALYNHNTDLVLGRTSAGTLELQQDDRGLYGRIKVNPNDTDAMNAYQRVARGDITGCSFGFEIEKEETEHRQDGTVHWTITKVNPLYEVSPCVFPAYTQTSVESRGRELAAMRKRELDAWRIKMVTKVTGGKNGTESPCASKED